MTVYEAEVAVIDAVTVLRRTPTGLATPGVDTVDRRWWRKLDEVYDALDVLEAIVDREAPG